MQILIEAKSRMQRVTYGRALLDLALTRICLLERLDSLAGLHGRLSDLPASSPPAVSRPAAAPARSPRVSGPPSESASKKNGIATETAAAPAIQVEPAETPEIPDAAAASETVPLQPDTIDAFWSQILLRSNDKIAAHLKNATQTAISGPNALEILFPAGYSFSKTYCERPETLKRIEKTASELAGRPLRIVIRAIRNRLPQRNRPSNSSRRPQGATTGPGPPGSVCDAGGVGVRRHGGGRPQCRRLHGKRGIKPDVQRD